MVGHPVNTPLIFQLRGDITMSFRRDHALNSSRLLLVPLRYCPRRRLVTISRGIWMPRTYKCRLTISARNYLQYRRHSPHRETILSLIQAIVSSLGGQIFIRKNKTVMRITVCICAPYNCRFQMEIKKDGDKPVFFIGASRICRAND